MPADEAPPLSRPDPGLILGRLVGLASDLAAVDLDEIDGEFYWRCCRADLWAPIAEHRASPTRPRPSPAEMAANPPFAYLRTVYEETFPVTRLYYDVRGSYPRDVFDRLLRGKRVPMRSPEVQHHATPGHQARSVLVYSGAWTGEDVERAFAGHFEDESVRRRDGVLAAEERLLRPRNPRAAAGARTRRTVMRSAIAEARGQPAAEVSLEMRVEFRLFTDPSTVFGIPGEVHRVPFVEVRVPPPLPPAGVIAREYDRVVRGSERWHLVLPGVASRQDKEVALRTWAVGLLTARGERFVDAMRTACGRTGVAEVSQSRFGQDRQRLVERVPEAKAYLLARETHPPALAKGDPADGPLQP